MKKLFLALVVVLGLNAVANAQDVGQMWVGGNLGFSTDKIEDIDRATSYKILPEFGYVINENIGVGIQLGYSHDEYASVYLEEISKNESFEVSPFLRYTFLKGDIGGLFVDAGVGYSMGKDKNLDLKQNRLTAGLRPGVAISISDKVSLTGKFGFIGYENTKQDVIIYDGAEYQTMSVKENKFSLNFDMSHVLLGVNVVF